MEHLHNHRDHINEKLERYGVTFGLYKNGVFKNQLFPFDTTPRIITKEEFEVIEKGLIQRESALNYFLEDIYTKRSILKDNIIPEDFIFSSPGYLEECLNITPPCIVVELGVGMRLTQTYCNQMTKGILNLMKEMGIWTDKRQYYIKEPIISTNKEVSFCNAGASGIFVPCINHDRIVKTGQKIGEIVDPLEAVVKDEVISPCDGLVFTLREYPVVYEGSLIARILEEVI